MVMHSSWWARRADSVFFDRTLNYSKHSTCYFHYLIHSHRNHLKCYYDLHFMNEKNKLSEVKKQVLSQWTWKTEVVFKINSGVTELNVHPFLLHPYYHTAYNVVLSGTLYRYIRLGDHRQKDVWIIFVAAVFMVQVKWMFYLNWGIKTIKYSVA